jgi:protein-S-isoprenylcysteine O-methyltransferase Ste14
VHHQVDGPAVLVFTWLYAMSPQQMPISVWFCVLWNGHYGYRSFVYPWVLRSWRRVPSTITASGAAFNTATSCFQAYYLFYLAAFPATWPWRWRFLVGLVLFLLGFGIHIHSDATLRSLRRSQQLEYAVPSGGLFRWVSCPNYFGELVQWAGWAVLTWSWPGFAFAVWTAANLIPRAIVSHSWYRATFPNYPRERRAIVPWVL